MKKIFLFSMLWLASQTGFCQSARHVVLISIDGLHPDMYLDKDWPTPNLRALMRRGTYAGHMLSVFPAYTYPSHTAMITGALPARSGMYYNQPREGKGEWNWEATIIKVPTLWQVLHEHGLTTSSVIWPGSAGADIDYNISEVWTVAHPTDRIGEARKHATPGLVEAIEQYATGKLDSTNMNNDYLSLDENTGRMAAYIFKEYKPNFLAVHLACVDGEEHTFGRDGDSVRLALEADDRAVGDLLEAIQKSGLQDSTTVIIVGDHGFCDIHTIFRPNLLIKNIPAKFTAAGGSCFLYRSENTSIADISGIMQAVIDSLGKLPKDRRKLFRIIYRKELDQMGADSSAILALAAVPGVVFSGAITIGPMMNNGPGTLIQQNPLDGVFIPTHGGHHGYDPNLPDMWTGFIAAGAGTIPGGHIPELRVTDIAPLVAHLLGIAFTGPDGKLVLGIIRDKP
jgi:predicted AlkP superfamily pyrophosphatase or phosphodiesterase